MRILIVSQYFYPEQFQINEIAPELVKRGHKVTVLTGLPNYPHGEIYDGYEQAYKDIENINGVDVIRCKMHPRKSGAVNLIRNYLSFWRNATKKAKKLKEEYDIVLSYQLSPIMSAKPAVAYAKKHKTPLLLYCLDIWPESAQAQIKNKNSLPYKLIAKLSKNIYAACDHIAVTSRPFIEYLSEENGIDKEKMSYIPQHADKRYLDEDFSTSASDTVNFMYAGNIGKGQLLEVIINAVAEIKDNIGFKVHIVGDGSQRAQLEELVKTLDVQDKVVFYGNQKREDMVGYYKMADALLLTLRGNNFVGNTMPGKLQAYMSTGKPIFAAINGAAAEVISEAECGACVPAGDSHGLAEIMSDFINNPSKYAKSGENARKYFAEHFTLDIYIEELEKRMEAMING